MALHMMHAVCKHFGSLARRRGLQQAGEVAVLSIGTVEQALCAEALHTPGGFLWWYADLVSPEGDGVVLIWAFGLPFLPGRESASRKGRGTPGRSQPSLAVSVYRAGKPVFYLLQEYDADDAEVDLESGRCRMGSSRFWSRVEGGRRVVSCELDVQVPASPSLEGELHIEGAALRNPTAALPAAGWHVWAPLTTATTGQARLRLGGRPLCDVTGRAYHDSNGSVAPLSGLGIEEWAWGREAVGDHEEVHYVLWPEGGGRPEAHLLRLGADGDVQAEEAEVLSAPRRYGMWGLPWHRELRLRGVRTGRERVVQPGSVVDDGPFYLRSLLGTGTAEWVRPGRVDVGFLRPFIDMCVHRPRGRNAWMLPFFSGERATRWRRLVGSRRPVLTAAAP